LPVLNLFLPSFDLLDLFCFDSFDLFLPLLLFERRRVETTVIVGSEEVGPSVGSSTGSISLSSGRVGSSVGPCEGDRVGLSVVGDGVRSTTGVNVFLFSDRVGDRVGRWVGLDDVGSVEGMKLGLEVGLREGMELGPKVWLCEGAKLDFDVGLSDKSPDTSDGSLVGESDGEFVGDSVGAPDGLLVGESVGDFVGAPDDLLLGDSVGEFVGEFDGLLVGDSVGDSVGDCLLFGASVGKVLCAVVGLVLGASVGLNLGLLVGLVDIQISAHSPVRCRELKRTKRFSSMRISSIVLLETFRVPFTSNSSKIADTNRSGNFISKYFGLGFL